jgi:hypothetical protein
VSSRSVGRSEPLVALAPTERGGCRSASALWNNAVRMGTWLNRLICNHPLPYAIVAMPNNPEFDYRNSLVFCAIINSLVCDFLLRQRVTAHLTFFLLNQLPMPQTTEESPLFALIVDRVARLLCTTPDFDGLAREVGIKNCKMGVTDVTERAKLRAELDTLVAHFYGLTEAEFAHVLSTFPLVPDPVKVAAQNAYRDVERGLIR